MGAFIVKPPHSLHSSLQPRYHHFSRFTSSTEETISQKPALIPGSFIFCSQVMLQHCWFLMTLGLKTLQQGAWRSSSAVVRTCCSPRGPGFDSFWHPLLATTGTRHAYSIQTCTELNIQIHKMNAMVYSIHTLYCLDFSIARTTSCLPNVLFFFLVQKNSLAPTHSFGCAGAETFISSVFPNLHRVFLSHSYRNPEFLAMPIGTWTCCLWTLSSL